MRENKKFFPANIWQAILALLVPVLCLAPLSFITNRYFNKEQESLLFLVLIGIFSSLFVYLINRRRKVRIRYAVRWPEKRLVLMLSAGIILFEIGINNPLIKTLSDSIGISTSSGHSAWLIFGAVVVGPVVEEVLFRGIILKGLLLNHRPLTAVLLSTILFTLIHVQPGQMLGAFIVGLLLAWVFYKTENIVLVIFFHSLANTASLLSSYLPSSPYFIPVSISILCLGYFAYRYKAKETGGLLGSNTRHTNKKPQRIN